MGYKSADYSLDDPLDGFKYMNQTDDPEFVTLGVDTVEISAGNDGRVNIWVNDIPKLVMALEAAYDTYPKPMKEEERWVKAQKW